MMRWALCAGLALPLLSSCYKAGPDFAPPEFPPPDAFVDRGAIYDAVDPEAAWWEGFDDPLLTSLIERAVAQNLDIQVAMASLAEARSLRTETKLELLPIVRAGAGYERVRLSEQTNFGRLAQDRDEEFFDIGATATWEIDLFGRIRRLVEARTAEIYLSEALIRDTLVLVTAEVGTTYFELRGNQSRLAVARKNAANQERTLELTNALLEGGRGTELDTARAREQLSTTLSLVPPLEQAIERSAFRLAVLLGEPPQALRDTLLVPASLPELPERIAIGDPASLLRRRPDIQAAEQALAAETALIGVAAADLFPRVTFVGAVALEANDFSSMFSSGADSHGFGPRISWAALDLGRVRARMRQAEARTDGALAVYERTVLLALEDTESALVTFGRQSERLRHLADAAVASAKAVRLARLRYEDGVADFLTVLDAERRQLEAEERLAGGKMRVATSLIAVYLALGGSWEPWQLAETS